MPSQIDMNSIMEKVSAFSKSNRGKKLMSNTIARYKRDGVRKTQAGSIIITEDYMHEVAQELIFDLQQMASQLRLEGVIPDSVARHFWSLDVRSIKSNSESGKYIVSIEFMDNLSRPSLMTYSASGSRTGGGIDNIISLFNTGYSAKGAVYGFWESAGIDTWSLPFRPRLGFMEDVLFRFNLKYASICEAELLW